MKKVAFITLLTLTLSITCLVTPAFADGEVQKQILPTSPFYLFVKIKESVQQFLTFNQDSKAQLLESFSNQRIKEIEYADFTGDDKALSTSLERYQAQKIQALGQVKGISDSRVVEEIKEGTLEQQQTMTKMQLEVKDSTDIQQHIVEVQKEIAGEVKKTVEVVQGDDEAAEIDNKIHYVWLDPNADTSGKLPPLPDEIKEWEYAPGTEGRDETGKVIEITYAPGTKVGGETGNKMEILWAPGTEGTGEGGIEYEGGPEVVIEENTGTGTSEVKKIEIQQVSGTSSDENKKVEIKKVEIKEQP